jgi:hypothetical protein
MPVVVRALGGSTRKEASRVLTQAILEDHRFDLQSVDRIHQAKSKLIQDQGVLEFLKVEEGLESVGGMTRLKAWLEKRRCAFSVEAARGPRSTQGSSHPGGAGVRKEPLR